MPTEPLPHFSERIRPVRHVAAGLVLAALAAGCSPSLPLAGRHPADPSVAVPAPSYVAVSGTKALRPAEPKSWQDLNRQVTPKGP